MRYLSRKLLRDFWAKHPQAEAPLREWELRIKNGHFKGPSSFKRAFSGADVLPDNRVIFDIAGNKFRLVAHINYEFQILLVKFVGTHAEYDRIDAATVGRKGK
ncbi:MAG: type II toxin-antitoxin system HigB family toxin [Polyangiales bacterium]|nr:type II toxin-antitoxin system HigB family toxin [Myxococcales bacterium]